ncbi:hypothetical protein [Paenibacillus ehimensis]|uniref:Uncharacterized protein n=1 Tax=Paenibacillus ehimensis TaxID=79264 RepID=A0ABT8V6N6_9BACL|nr:hypothetical protein [Paenibacillus ehimensis]MDO3677110.1 hypothetical protein [Paenibacillus ehimensis]
MDHWFRLLTDKVSEMRKTRAGLVRKEGAYNPAQCSQAIMEVLAR